jgi:carbamoyl-phosphate synthase large subunit
MKNITVLLTEVGGPAGISALKSFKKFNNNVITIGFDFNPLAVGLKLCNKPFICPPAIDKINYKNFLLNIINKEKINFILPTGQHDLKILSSIKDITKCKIYISDIKTIDVCQNKLKFYNTFNKILPLPLTLNKRLIKKPINGVGSRNISIIECENDYIIQEYIEGTEYTVDAFFDDHNKLIQHIIRKRSEIKNGISVKSQIIKNIKISNIVYKISKLIKFIGPINIQIIKTKNEEYKIIEINPRLAGTSIVSTLAGFNFAEYYYNLYLGFLTKIKKLRYITVSRYLEEIIV